MNRELRAALGLVLAGGVLLLVVGGRTWATVEGAQPAPLPDVRTALTGADLVPGLRALALAALAGAAAVLAARPRWRPAVGAVLALVGAGTLLAVAGVVRDPLPAVRDAADGRLAPSSTDGAVLGAWPWLAAAGALLVLLAGLLVLVRGRRWAGLAARYDAPAARPAAAASSTTAWDDLDRGVDPTAPASVQPTARQQEETP